MEPDRLLPVYGWEDHYFLCAETQSVYTRKKNGQFKKIKEQMRNGYLEVYFDKKINGRQRRSHYTLNRVILMTLTKSNPSNKDAHHNNKIRTDNRPLNLRWLDKKLNRGCRWYKRNCNTLDMFQLAEIGEKQDSDPF
jgi:hypothetical protein